MHWRERDGLRWLEAELPGARAAFSTRLGGVSEAPFASLNLGILTGDRAELVRENRIRLCAALGRAPDAVLIGRQVHGAELAAHSAPQPESYFAAPGPEPPHLDGHLAADPTLTPLVFVADCLPIALAGRAGVAVLHGGWRGLAAGIVERGVGALGGVEAAAIGPGVGRCCYEVGDEVLSAFEGLGEGIASGRMLDLVEVARRLLARAGVEELEVSGLCTSCEPELFFSHRRDGERTGRQAGLAWRTS